MKKLFRFLMKLIGIVLLLFVLLIVLLTVTEYKPEPRQNADIISADPDAPLADHSLTLYSWNIGYAGLGEESDCFMDGGTMVYPPSQEVVKKNFDGILDFMAQNPADAWLLQEVDLKSSRTNYTDQITPLANALGGNHSFAYNYKCLFVPIPFPPIGYMESGVATFTGLQIKDDAQRIALPCPFSWPVSTANLKRCLLVNRLPIEGSDQELVLVNLHLEAYDDGEGKIAQTKFLMDILQEEYKKGNYVIAGGDFNQTFPGALDAFPIADPSKWTPGVLEKHMLTDGWRFAFDSSCATCRLLDQPYSDACQLYVIDGFILSPNVKPESVQTVDLGFRYSDHNPVKLEVTLLPADQE